MQNILNSIIFFSLTTGINILLIIIFSVLIYIFVSSVLNKVILKVIKKTDRSKRAETLRKTFFGTIKFVIILVALLMILSELGLDIAPLLASAGLLGLAISMGSREIVADFLSGIFILLDDLYQIGDRVKISGVEGEIIDIDLRKTTIKTEDGTIHIIPNGKIKEVAKK